MKKTLEIWGWMLRICKKKSGFFSKYIKPKKIEKWYFVTKIVLTYVRKNCSSDPEKLLKFEAEGREFAKCFRSLEQFIQTVNGQNNFL